MAFFKFRKGGDEPAATQRPPESVEAMRRRARHRLIGAAVLVLVGVVGFPLLFDTQPRPIAVDIPIEIPDRNKAKPLPVPAQAVRPVAAASGVVSAAPAATVARVEAPASAPKAEAPAEPKPEPAVVAKVEPKPPEAKPETPKAEAKPAKPSDDGAKALALLEGKQVEAGAAGRFVVQVGAFADAALARETRQKVEKAGLKTYTHVADTKDGKRTRVRVGPFGTRDEANKAAEKIKGLDLPASVLTL